MKITKEARQLSRQLFRLSFTDKKLDRAKVNSLVQSIIAESRAIIWVRLRRTSGSFVWRSRSATP